MDAEQAVHLLNAVDSVLEFAAALVFGLSTFGGWAICGRLMARGNGYGLTGRGRM